MAVNWILSVSMTSNEQADRLLFEYNLQRHEECITRPCISCGCRVPDIVIS